MKTIEDLTGEELLAEIRQTLKYYRSQRAYYAVKGDIRLEKFYTEGIRHIDYMLVCIERSLLEK